MADGSHIEDGEITTLCMRIGRFCYSYFGMLADLTSKPETEVEISRKFVTT